MGNITPGEERFIDEAGREWKRLLDNQIGKMDNVPSEVIERIDNLYNSYRKEFEEYYRAEAEKGEISYSDDVLQEFETEWNSNHPEFYDINRLLGDCSREMLEKYREDLDRIQNIFS